MAPQAQLPFVLRPLTPPDIRPCAHIAALAFSSDRQTQLKALSTRNPYNHEVGTQAGLESWLSRPPGAVEMTVAADGTTGEVVGWVVWGFRGFNSAEAIARRERELEQVAGTETGRVAGGILRDAKGEEAIEKLIASSKSTRDAIEAYTGADMNDWMKRLMPPGCRCMFVCSIAVHPAHQGRGVGSALIRQGTNRADAEGVYCWVHASESGAEMFAKQGFEEIGRLDLDLDRWNLENVTPPPLANGMDATSWGIYRFAYMRRDPTGRERSGHGN